MRPLRLSDQIHRLMAVGVLLGLLATLSHVHTGAEYDAAEGLAIGPQERVAATANAAPALLPDDAHHEHSPTLARGFEPCLGCRTRNDADQAVAVDPDPIFPAAFVHHQGDTSPIPCDSTDRRLPGVRAPPPCRA